MSSVGWRLVRAGTGKGAVLCLNFTVAGVRGQASFGDLASQLPEGYAVWGPDENAWPTGTDLPRAQLQEWLDRACAVDTPVRAVLGFCGTAALASLLARRLTGGNKAHGAPAVVLFDPIVVGPQNMVDQAVDSLRQLAALAPAGDQPDPEDALPIGDLPIGDVGEAGLEDGDLGELATRLVRHYAARAGAVGAARSVRASTVAELCRRFETYLRYLTLCTTAWSHQPVAADLFVLSRDHGVPTELPGTPLARLETTQHKLLAHPEAARAAAQVLAGLLVNGRA